MGKTRKMGKKGKISPSMMCVPITEIAESVRIFEDFGIEYLHMDIMDGSFVPNFTLGTDYVRQLRRLTKIPLDLHFMVEKPEDKLDWFDIQAGDFVSVHYESTRHLQRVCAKIREKGAKSMVALNPATPLCVLEDILPDLDGVLIMAVNPGFAGQRIIPQMEQKVAKLRKMLDSGGFCNVEIEVDGNMSRENSQKMRAAGADIFVGGSSGLFVEGRGLAECVAEYADWVG